MALNPKKEYFSEFTRLYIMVLLVFKTVKEKDQFKTCTFSPPS